MITTNFAQMFDPQNFAKAFDYSKYMSPNNMPKWWPDLKATNMNLNGIDYEALIAAQRKNFDAMAAANQSMMGSLQSIFQRQADIFRETMESAAQLMQDAMATGTPEEKLARQATIAKAAYETATRNMQELAEMVTESQQACIKTMNDRVAASFDDLRAAVEK